MNIEHDEAQGRFRTATEFGEAVVDYRRSGREVNFAHTFVPPEARNRGIAEALVRHALDWAEQNRLNVEASCWYVARHLEMRRRRTERNA